jgi:hypothetical protein
VGSDAIALAPDDAGKKLIDRLRPNLREWRAVVPFSATAARRQPGDALNRNLAF